MSSTIAIEARAQHNYFMKNQLYGDQTGLSCFAPVVNIMRHPLWGRNQVELSDFFISVTLLTVVGNLW